MKPKFIIFFIFLISFSLFLGACSNNAKNENSDMTDVFEEQFNTTQENVTEVSEYIDEQFIDIEQDIEIGEMI